MGSFKMKELQFDTKIHCSRTALYSTILASACEFCKKDIRNIFIAAMAHDIGKIDIPEYILNKPGRLTKEEYKIMKQHAEKGAEMLKDSLSPELIDMIRYHHENMDGTGYYGLTGSSIPKGARIIHICDVYDALITKRQYKLSWDKKDALLFLKRNAGTMFDQSYTEIFCKIMQQAKIRK